MSEEAKQREGRVHEALYKTIDEELKVLADLKRYVFTAFLAVTVGTFNADQRIAIYAGVIGGFILLVLFFVLTLARSRKIKAYKND